MQTIPYSLLDKRVYDVESGKNYSIKISDVKFKSKLAFLFQTYGVNDTINVTLTTLNRKILVKKNLNNSDCVLRHEPFRKSENYFLMVNIKSSKEKSKGCFGMVIMERVTKKAFKKVQTIKWKFEEQK